MEEVKVKITHSHISSSKRSSHVSCALATAIKEQMNTSDVYVTTLSAYVNGQKYEHDGKGFLAEFDLTGKCEPTTVTLTKV